MYADRVETAPKSSIKDRLNGGTLDSSGRRRQVTGKRFASISVVSFDSHANVYAYLLMTVYKFCIFT